MIDVPNQLPPFVGTELPEPGEYLSTAHHGRGAKKKPRKRRKPAEKCSIMEFRCPHCGRIIEPGC